VCWEEGVKMGYIYVYTGTGAGKTTNALGLALRCIGHKKKAIIIQFLKWWKNIGEYKIRNRLKPYYEIYQFGRPGWIKIEDGKTKTIKINGHVLSVRSIDELDKKLCEKGLEFAKKIMLKKKPTLLVLDEINLAVKWKLIDVKKVLEFLELIPEKTHVVLTGRYAHKKIIEKADFVNIIIDKKSPKEMVTTQGIQY
jgi:cob(I)alamin adenosyltransferase